MGTLYGKDSMLVTPSMIEDIIVDNTGRTTFTINVEENGAARVVANMVLNSSNNCQSNNGIFIRIKDVIPWNRLYVRILSTGTASCHGWNGNNDYGSGMNSTQQSGNLLNFNQSAGDYTKNEFNVWDNPTYVRSFRMCDNNANNYMRFNSSGRGWDMFCRRNSMATLAGPSHGRTCSTTGTVTFTNMRIMIF